MAVRDRLPLSNLICLTLSFYLINGATRGRSARSAPKWATDLVNRLIMHQPKSVPHLKFPFVSFVTTYLEAIRMMSPPSISVWISTLEKYSSTIDLSSELVGSLL